MVSIVRGPRPQPEGNHNHNINFSRNEIFCFYRLNGLILQFKKELWLNLNLLISWNILNFIFIYESKWLFLARVKLLLLLLELENKI